MNILKFICFLILHLFFFTSFGKKSHDHHCAPSSCGSIRNIAHPFRLQGDPPHCGQRDYELSCEDNKTLILHLNSHRYAVRTIDYNNYTIRVADISITNDVCSFPRASLGPNNFIRNGYPYSVLSRFGNYTYPSDEMIVVPVSLISCMHEVINASRFVPIASYCAHTDRSIGDVNGKRYSYIKIGHFNGSDLMDTCRIDVIVMTSSPSLLDDEGKSDVSLSRIHGSLLYGFELSWLPSLCGNQCYHCRLVHNKAQCRRAHLICASSNAQECVMDIMRASIWLVEFVLLANTAPRILIGMPCVLAFLIYKFRRRHLSMFHAIETFLQKNGNLMPIRYSYSNIKKMTRGFREKLGEGGYGSVYKGKLRSGHAVGVKILKKPKANPQEFINEIATIGRIHHVNVVKLVGYCFEGSTCALVYDFMINGSLDQYIFCEERARSLSLEKKYEIAVGVARGIEYLHQGCNIQILHFDIKPHNILLDQNFTPKLSDFGLAKLYSTERSMVTLTAARGTIGYVAPELINRSIGRVSSKADVYSFGMLLLEIVGLKGDIIVHDDESSKYFPNWIYDCFERGIDIETGIYGESDDNDDEHVRAIARKMTIVGLWCIQMFPQDRPSMNEVLKLLEGNVENLQIPPHPSKSILFVHHNARESESIYSISSTATEDVSNEINPVKV